MTERRTRAGKGWSFYLTTDTRKRLEYLAADWQLSMSGALDLMIAHAYLESMKEHTDAPR